MSAAERAKRVVARRTGNTLAGDLAVTALMADPDLLVDLAVEAGGLNHVLPTTVHIGWAQDRFTVTADPGTVEVLYRRVDR